MICFLSLQVEFHYLEWQTNYITHGYDFISNIPCSSDYSFNVNALHFSLTFCFLSCCCHKKLWQTQLQSLNYGSRVQFAVAGKPRHEELEAAVHIAPTVRKQSDEWMLLLSPLSACVPSRIPWGWWCCLQRTSLPTPRAQSGWRTYHKQVQRHIHLPGDSTVPQVES